MNALIGVALGREVAEKVYGGKGSVPAGWQIDTTFNQNDTPGELMLANGFYAYALKPTEIGDT